MKNQMSFFDYLAGLPGAPSPEGSYFVYGTDAYKKNGTGWLKLGVVLGPPKFGYRDLPNGYDLIQPDYVGAYWENVPEDEKANIEIRYASGEMEPVDHYLSVDLSYFQWKWQRNRQRDPDGTVSVASAPGGGSVRLKKIPGRKVAWIFSLDILTPDDRLFTRIELGLWCGMLYLGDVETAERLVVTSFTERLLDLQQKIKDADSGRNFGADRSMEKTTPLILAKKIIALKRINHLSPLAPTEMKRLLELNGERNTKGRFHEDPLKDLSLDHLYAELICRYIAFGMVPEDVWGDGPPDWVKVRDDLWHKGFYHVIKARQMRESKHRVRFVAARSTLSNGPIVRGAFSSVEKAIAATEKTVFVLPFLVRNCDGNREDFTNIKREILAAATREMNSYTGRISDESRAAA